MQHLFRQYRHALYNYESVFPYAVLGVVGGVASALLILAFDQAIIYVAALWDVGDAGDDFESLPRWLHFALPALGGLALGLVFSLIPKENREVGVVHVLSRMHTDYGVLPARNMVVQFFGGVVALATGQSGGREGPGVHLGAAINSLIGQRLRLPNNSLRVLIACGTAGGISVAFNTPLAGVIFAMEVIVAEYTVIGFVPVILAAVSAMAVSRAIDRADPLVDVAGLDFHSLTEIPLVLLIGFGCGAMVALFISLSRWSARLLHWHVSIRFTLAGVITGALALLTPAVLGMGYDSMDSILLGQMGVTALLLLVACKVLATGISNGLGLPIGLIGPNLLMGACMGALLGDIGLGLMPELATDRALYGLIGMGAAMAAVLNAPLAALLAVIELTGNLEIVMPAMLAIIVAVLTNTELFRQKSAHQSRLQQLRRVVPDDPLNQLLHRTHVTRAMETSVNRVPITLDRAAMESLRQHSPNWCLVERERERLFLLRGAELRQWLQDIPAEQDDALLTEAPLRRWSLSDVPVQASLQQVVDAMNRDTTEAVCVYGKAVDKRRKLMGVVTRETVENFTLSRLRTQPATNPPDS